MKCIESDVKTFSNLIDVYLGTNARYFTQNASKFASDCELFVQAEYTGLFDDQSMRKPIVTVDELKRKLFVLSETEFQHIIMWGNGSERTKAASLCSANRQSTTIDDWSQCFDHKWRHINEILSILSLKIQSA